jgi:hypothetical protein
MHSAQQQAELSRRRLVETSVTLKKYFSSAFKSMNHQYVIFYSFTWRSTTLEEAGVKSQKNFSLFSEAGPTDFPG